MTVIVAAPVLLPSFQLEMNWLFAGSYFMHVGARVWAPLAENFTEQVGERRDILDVRETENDIGRGLGGSLWKR